MRKLHSQRLRVVAEVYRLPSSGGRFITHKALSCGCQVFILLPNSSPHQIRPSLITFTPFQYKSRRLNEMPPVFPQCASRFTTFHHPIRNSPPSQPTTRTDHRERRCGRKYAVRSRSTHLKLQTRHRRVFKAQERIEIFASWFIKIPKICPGLDDVLLSEEE
ncbi:hypothetical protein J6590_063121 [Homalodisca vitripennis]|nr:hypothetical protein J6590_063121 [Homalodisca vitripennis]